MIETLLTIQVNNYYVAVIFWNIFLALLPCLIAWRLSRGYYLKKWGNMSQMNHLLFGLVFLVWFFFFPNTAYLIADVRHLADYCKELDYFRTCVDEAWVVPLFFTYSLIGVPTFYYSLKKMATILEKLFGKTVRRLFPLLMIPITALGLLLGLVARFNSWEVIYKPLNIIKTVFGYLSDETMLINLLAYTLMLYFVYYSIDFLWKKRK
ncbi:DUF1361 domain-containing protein [Candidatus Peregrinibacteria bacterium]|nr:DUF1361 domain-containing protein [Candidatus Peregrinibacteria bacterium]